MLSNWDNEEPCKSKDCDYKNCPRQHKKNKDIDIVFIVHDLKLVCLIYPVLSITEICFYILNKGMTI